MEFLIPRWWDFFPQRITLFREATIVHIFILLSKPTQNFPKKKSLILRIIKNESKKVLEKCGLQCEMLEPCQALLTMQSTPIRKLICRHALLGNLDPVKFIVSIFDINKFNFCIYIYLV